ncbi:MAG: TIGR00730 family Rossman fold protein, partial [Acinetobacter sp.]
MNSVLPVMMNESFELDQTNPNTTQTLIALYCGSRFGNKPIYKEKAIHLAKSLAE